MALVIVDVLIQFLLIFLKSGIFMGVLYLLAREQTKPRFKSAFWLTVLASFLYLICKTDVHYVSTLKAAGVCILIIAWISKARFYLFWWQGWTIATLFVLLGVSLSDGAKAVMDRAFPDRETLATKTIDLLESYTYRDGYPEDYEPSATVPQALMAGLAKAGESGPLSVVAAFGDQIKAGYQTIETVKDIQTNADARVEFIDSLANSDAITDAQLTDDAYTVKNIAKQAQEKGEQGKQDIEAAQQANQQAPQAPDPKPAPSPGQTPAQQTAQQPAQPPAGKPAKPEPAANGAEPVADTKGSEGTVDSGTSVEVNASRAEVTLMDVWRDPGLQLSYEQLSKLRSRVPKPLRNQWFEDKHKIEIRSVMKYNDGRSAAIINGQLMQPGGQITFDTGETYRLVSINAKESFWMAQYNDGESTSKHLLHKSGE